jgi:salicylate hydroxylase
MSKFLIAGAGIAGLSAALALARSNHSITVLEQASELSEVGAGIQLGPNAMHILMGWGLGEAILNKGCEPIDLIVRDGKDDEQLASRRLDAARTRYGAPHVCIRRADLQSVLLQAAISAGVEIQLAQTLDAETIKSYAARYDALLGCDGLHSNVREHVLQDTKHNAAPRATGHTAYRAMLDMALLPLDLRSQSVQVWLGAAQHVVVYPVNQRQLNIVIAQEGAPTLAKPMSAQLHTLIGIVEANGGFSEWPLFDRLAMLSPKYYAKGNIALLGDAAHPMKPYLAQGAAMAIEDADALAKAIQSNDLQANIDMALQAYAKARWKRNAHVQFRSQLQGFAFHASGVVRLARNAVLRVAGTRITDMPWLYSYQNS